MNIIYVKPRCPSCGHIVGEETSYGRFTCRHCHRGFVIGERPKEATEVIMPHLTKGVRKL